ncbi:phosphotransferase [Lederbergia wuyishanensis]|uniref:Thiamine kinase-like enzyme n=1 Tax=Lederbergia wuyishanensis TaxID=1347903 RepID=A0ABU0D3U7_9BACI|nr:phosphotransferase [Lederbergia wuyishanensis]MCJ8007783.1 phosphotransferase [Lederbergia wuyishanensis]MDQ0343054.1 thiamine kinase-like enzyme [Lederbergia wuyishanensis]
MKQAHHISQNKILQLIHTYYGFLPDSISFIPFGDKSYSYKIRCMNGNTFYLKLLDKKIQQEAITQTSYYLPLLTELHEKDLYPPANYPILTKENRNKIEIEEIVLVLFPWINGPTLADSYPLTESYIRQIAQLLAELHLTTSKISSDIHLPAETFNVEFLDELSTFVKTLRQRPAPSELVNIIAPKEKGIISLIMQIKKLSNTIKNKHFPFVICHGDLWGGNLIQSPSGLRVIDWESVILAPMERELANYITQMPITFIQAYEEKMESRVNPNIDLLRFFSYRTQLHNLYSWLKNLLVHQLDEEQQFNDIDMIKNHCLNRWDGIEEGLQKLEKKVGER